MYIFVGNKMLEIIIRMCYSTVIRRFVTKNPDKLNVEV